MGEFVEIPGAFLKTIAEVQPRDGMERIAALYFSGPLPVRYFFWMRLRRIHALIERFGHRRECALDFGSGAGIFLPTLAKMFRTVTSVDLRTDEASSVRQHYGLTNAELVNADIATVELGAAPFDAIVAADVLEHFSDLTMPVDRILAWLREDGLLYTSLPTESWLYVLLRRVFGFTKPVDHYHTAAQVEAYLRSRGLVGVARRHVPPGLALLALFNVVAWRKQPPTRGPERKSDAVR